jgi:hypothetical protein
VVRAVRATGPSGLRRSCTSENIRLRRVCRYPQEWSIGRRQDVFRISENPMGAAGLLSDPLVPALVKYPEVPGPTRHGSPRRRGFDHERGQRRRKSLRRCGSDGLRRGLGSSGTTAVGPGQAGSSALESAEFPDLVFLRVRGLEHRGREGAAGAETHHGLPVRKSFSRGTPERQRT